MSGDRMLSDGSRPFPVRVRELHDAWVEGGRAPALLPTGTAFFAVYCWSHNHQVREPAATAYSPELAEFVTAAYQLNGGPAGWNAMLGSRENCSTCHDRYLLENLGICTGCMRYLCYGCGPHQRCAGELL